LANSVILFHPLESDGRIVPDEILTLPDVARLLKVADKTVYTMAQEAQIPAFKVRGQWRFKRADLDRWIERQKAASRGVATKRGRA
jgi:excisionase family DNA binding protein